ncbi:cation transporter [Pseudoxanthomonas broegbernensis]|uniref:Cation transporter n=1 Tax=Pseudoxanthomonas broegbernensis TaxID=83619 RepID=A0A7V8GLP7_9GAMM|nr:cation diffusion facilitator family transporter [Pseudoxanthomonas broegbernensis]KAF1685904.1 cation transporter [Pseudoxanthomonas broegbernensis]MBB6064132.1 cobalt-zinc-cadmium efflux system protein [Pseudoxanthomonas broegbernensis]
MSAVHDPRHEHDRDPPHGHGHAGHHHGPGGHSHVPSEIRYERPLWWALGLTATVLVAEAVGAWLTNSLALLSDAAHMATDTLALAIALVAVRLARRPPDARRTYGYARFEALGALANGGLLFLLAGYILWEAWHRFRSPLPVASMGMLGVAVVGLACNLVAMRLLHAGSGQSLNLKGAYLEVWSDMLGSLAVIVAAIVIGLTGWLWVDPLLAVLIGLWVLPRTWVLVREALNVLMEGVPRGVDLAAVRADVQAHPRVSGLHDLHVWALASSTPAMTAHVVVAAGADAVAVRRELEGMLVQRHRIAHVTLQMEAADEAHCAGCGDGAH